MNQEAQKLWQTIVIIANNIAVRETGFQMRRRVNPHHPEDQVEGEKRAFDRQQAEDFFRIKEMYTTNRESLIKELPLLDEKIIKDANGISEALESCVADDIERTMLAGTDHIDP